MPQRHANQSAEHSVAADLVICHPIDRRTEEARSRLAIDFRLIEGMIDLGEFCLSVAAPRAT